jgi:adenylate cyclase
VLVDVLVEVLVGVLVAMGVDALKVGEDKQITAFFSDIVSSSAISEKLSGSDLTSFLNEYFSTMTEILKAEGGTVDKFVGDSLIGIFGAPLALDNHARSAARAALRMLERLGRLRSEWKRRKAWCPEAWSLRIRIGLNSGHAKVGLFGTADLITYSMLGPTVNVAKRLEQACAFYGTSLLVGEATRNMIADEMVLRRLDRLRLGTGGPFETVYELLGEKGSVAAKVVRAAEVFEAAQELHDRRRWAEAACLFRQVLQLRGGNDAPAARLLRRCERLRDRSSTLA